MHLCFFAESPVRLLRGQAGLIDLFKLEILAQWDGAIVRRCFPRRELVLQMPVEATAYANKECHKQCRDHGRSMPLNAFLTSIYRCLCGFLCHQTPASQAFDTVSPPCVVSSSIPKTVVRPACLALLISRRWSTQRRMHIHDRRNDEWGCRQVRYWLCSIVC